MGILDPQFFSKRKPWAIWIKADEIISGPQVLPSASSNTKTRYHFFFLSPNYCQAWGHGHYMGTIFVTLPTIGKCYHPYFT